MTDIMIDMTSKPAKRYVINRCHYCDHDKYPEGKVIDPTNDKYAYKTPRGDWKCGYCTVKDMIEMNDPNRNRNMGNMS